MIDQRWMLLMDNDMRLKRSRSVRMDPGVALTRLAFHVIEEHSKLVRGIHCTIFSISSSSNSTTKVQSLAHDSSSHTDTTWLLTLHVHSWHVKEGVVEDPRGGEVPTWACSTVRNTLPWPFMPFWAVKCLKRCMDAVWEVEGSRLISLCLKVEYWFLLPHVLHDIYT